MAGRLVLLLDNASGIEAGAKAHGCDSDSVPLFIFLWAAVNHPNRKPLNAGRSRWPSNPLFDFENGHSSAISYNHGGLESRSLTGGNMARVPELSRDNIPEDQRAAFDEMVQQRGGVPSPGPG